MIPKIIHFCWFGKNEYPRHVKKCINSWKKYCPDYEIKLWNEENYDVYKNKFVHEAYTNKKWAFVSDYARLDIIYSHGGFYLDTDVKLIKSLNHLTGMESFFSADELGINTGLGFGSVKKKFIIKEMMNYYEERTFIINGSMDLTPCTIPNSQPFIKKGYFPKNEIQIFDGIQILPPEYFSPIQGLKSELKLTKNTIGIHLSSRSWDRTTNRYKAALRLLLGIKLINKIKKIYKR